LRLASPCPPLPCSCHCRSPRRCQHGALASPRITRSFAVLIILNCIAYVAPAQIIRVDITPEHVANTFVPNQALGAGIDRMPAAAIDKLFTPAALDRVLSAGWQPVTYRQNT